MWSCCFFGQFLLVPQRTIYPISTVYFWTYAKIKKISKSETSRSTGAFILNIQSVISYGGNPPVVVLVFCGEEYQCQYEGQGDEHESKSGERVGHGLFYGVGRRICARPIIQVRHDLYRCIRVSLEKAPWRGPNLKVKLVWLWMCFSDILLLSKSRRLAQYSRNSL